MDEMGMQTLPHDEYGLFPTVRRTKGTTTLSRLQCYPSRWASRRRRCRKQQKAQKNGKKPPRRKFLDTYCENLTCKAWEGKLDDIVGRDREIYRTIQILSRRQKNNQPRLIGEAGVGKTAIAEGIAERIARGNVPVGLKGGRISLPAGLTSLVAGTWARAVRAAGQGPAERGQGCRATSSCSLTRSTPSPPPVRARVPGRTRATSSNPPPAVRYRSSAPPPSTSTASISRRIRPRAPLPACPRGRAQRGWDTSGPS